MITGPKLIFVDGIVGTGKSRLAQRLWLHLRKTGVDAEWFAEPQSGHPLHDLGDLSACSASTALETVLRAWRSFVAERRTTARITLLDATLLQTTVRFFESFRIPQAQWRPAIAKLLEIAEPLSPGLIYLRPGSLDGFMELVAETRGAEWRSHVESEFAHVGGLAGNESLLRRALEAGSGADRWSRRAIRHADLRSRWMERADTPPHARSSASTRRSRRMRIQAISLCSPIATSSRSPESRGASTLSTVVLVFPPAIDRICFMSKARDSRSKDGRSTPCLRSMLRVVRSVCGSTDRSVTIRCWARSGAVSPDSSDSGPVRAQSQAGAGPNLKRVIAALDEAHARLAEVERRRHEPLAIIGMACRSPLGDDAEDLWKALLAGRDGVRPISARALALKPKTTTTSHRDHAVAKRHCSPTWRSSTPAFSRSRRVKRSRWTHNSGCCSKRLGRRWRMRQSRANDFRAARPACSSASPAWTTAG